MRPLLAGSILAAACMLAGVFGYASASPSRTGARAAFSRTGEEDVSRLRGVQSEVSIAVDPSNAQILLAGSNDVTSGRMRVYASRDGGRGWTRRFLPWPPSPYRCEESDPAVGIGPGGRQYYVFLGLACRRHALRGTGLFLAMRARATARWRIERPIALLGARRAIDDHPGMTVDVSPSSPYAGRIYVAWTRFSLHRRTLLPREVALLSHSDDGGRTWSKPTPITRVGSPLEIRLATSADGALYAVWRDVANGSVSIAAATDGTHFSRAQIVAAAAVPYLRPCRGFYVQIRAQPDRCISSTPAIAVDRTRGPFAGRVYVSFGATWQRQDAFVAVYDSRLDRVGGLAGGRVNPEESGAYSDQFMPSVAVDQSSGRVWVCYYDTSRDARGRRARYSCSASDDGGQTWAFPIAAASADSNETRKRANRGNGYGDYEGIVAAGGLAHPIWTDSRSLRPRKEEIYTAVLSERRGAR